MLSGSQKDCGPGKRDGARFGERRESQVLPGDKVRYCRRTEGTPRED